MKKLLLFATIIFVMLTASNSYAEYKFYEKGDLKISIQEMSACMLYDIKNKETLGGLITSPIQYKSLNLDIGCIGVYDNLDEFDELDIFVGISADVNSLKINDNLYGSVGLFASPGWIDNGKVRYGGYGKIGVKF